MSREKVWMWTSKVMSLQCFIANGVCANEEILAPITYSRHNEHTVKRSWIRGEGGKVFKMIVMLWQL